ncbi:MAG: hypothetical protein HY506_01205 [Candidatus Yanofskybacteria bacterium]|nr:hypothetical protein [Candidatus Yanofskybacteria bacterium]
MGRKRCIFFSYFLFAAFLFAGNVFSQELERREPNKPDDGKSHSCCHGGDQRKTVSQHFPYGGQESAPDTVECHNYEKRDKNGKKIKPNCECWGRHTPDAQKCPPPKNEDSKCKNHCKYDLCTCKVRCKS